MQGKLFTTVETFGLSDEAKWQARYIDFTGDVTRFTVFKDGHSWGEFETNLIGALRLTQALLPLMRMSPAGRVVNLSSGMGQLADMEAGAPARIDSRPTSIATMRSSPSASPPCGGAPKLSASSRKPNFTLASSS